MVWDWRKKDPLKSPEDTTEAPYRDPRRDTLMDIAELRGKHSIPPRDDPSSPPTGWGQMDTLAGPQQGNNWLEHQMSELNVSWGDVIKAGLATIPGVIDRLHKSPQERMVEDIFASRREQLVDARRRARGQLTGAETQDILNNPALQRIASNLAAAGLEGSGAGQQILSQSIVGAFDASQERAVRQVEALELGTFDMAKQWYEEDEGFATLAGQLFALFENDTLTGEQDPMLAKIDELVTSVIDESNETQKLIHSMLNPAPTPQ